MWPPSSNFLSGTIFDKPGNCMVCLQMWMHLQNILIRHFFDLLFCCLAVDCGPLTRVWHHSPDLFTAFCYRFSLQRSPAALKRKILVWSYLFQFLI